MSWYKLYESEDPTKTANIKAANQEVIKTGGDPAPKTPQNTKPNLFPNADKKAKTGNGPKPEIKPSDKKDVNAHNTGVLGSFGKKTSQYVGEESCGCDSPEMTAKMKKYFSAGMGAALAGATNTDVYRMTQGEMGDEPSDGTPQAPESGKATKANFPSEKEMGGKVKSKKKK